MSILLVVVCLILSACAPAPSANSDDPGEPLPPDSVAVVARRETLIPELMAEARVPGLQIALIRDGRVVTEKGYGVTGGPDGATVDADTIFEAASLTKPVFAYAVMKMVDQGLVDLDRPVIEYLPREEVEQVLGHALDADGFRADWFKTITARHILSHSAGLPHGEGGEVTPIFFEPGSDWKYSAEGYMFLQRAIERLAGEPLDAIIDASVLQPLGMVRSSMVWRDDLEAKMARGHSVYGNVSEIRKRSEPTAAASLYTTAGDYARFVIGVIDGAGLDPGTHREMLDWVVDMSDDGSVGWSLGFGLQRDDEGMDFWQWGDFGIFRSYVIASANDRSGVVYLTNSFNGLALCDELVRATFGRPPLGCLELEYQPPDSLFYSLFWTAKDEGVDALAERLPSAVETDPEFFDSERISGMAGIFDDEKMYDEAAVFHRYNLERRPDSGEVIFNMAQHHLLTGDFERAEELFSASLTAAEEPVDADRVEWIMGYLRAMRAPVQIDEAELRVMAGDYGPRHLRVRDGRLFYSRDTVDISAQRPLLAQAPDIFVLEGVTYFKLQIVLDEKGEPIKLVGLYEDGRRDVSPRDG